MSFVIVLQGISVVTYLVILSGGKRLRENGWGFLSMMIGLSAIVQAAGMSIVVSWSCLWELLGSGKKCANTL